jgi:archaetidylinositol phosphate synthase
MPATTAFPDDHPAARRELTGVTSRLERRALLWLSARTPSRVGPDHLTTLGVAGLGVAGAAYAASARWPWLLLVASAGLALNWLGDSLDGTLARYRTRTRPRYGHYVDHVVDALGAVALLGGLAGSGWITPSVGLGLLVGYLLFLVHMGYAAHTTGRFTMSYQGIGGTELRIGLVLLNTLVFLRSTVTVSGRGVLVFDIAGSIALLGMAVMLVRAVWATAVVLDRADRSQWSDAAQDSSGRRVTSTTPETQT